MCGDRRAPLRQLIQYRYIEVTEDRHCDGTRDRRRRHDKDVRGVLTPLSQCITLLDTEAMLFIDDEKVETCEIDSFGDQGMRPDH